MSPEKQGRAAVRRGPKVPVTVAEWDVTAGLHEWIEGEIQRQEEAARSADQGRWAATREKYEEWDAGVESSTAGTVANCHAEEAQHIALHDPASVLRRCVADRKILAAHPYTTAVINPSYGQHSAGFGCETCHDWDGVPEGRGNCATILALAEGYGLDEADETDVEVVHE
ncbi:DUF6221 family protein [Streptomyces drozdowiczii]|uniref:DUF6221 family protein n=1 Tax=Streptomyces drozdowiczii TaxID=202862 RepID=UPI00403D533B